MYEFLAPWGAFIPLVSAAIPFLVISELRRKRLMRDIQSPSAPDERPFSSMSRHLSLVNG